MAMGFMASALLLWLCFIKSLSTVTRYMVSILCAVIGITFYLYIMNPSAWKNILTLLIIFSGNFLVLELIKTPPGEKFSIKKVRWDYFLFLFGIVIIAAVIAILLITL